MSGRRVARRVVHVTAHYPPYVGGVENAVAAMVTELARRGARVEVLTSDVAARDRPRDTVEAGVRVRRHRAVLVGNTPVFPGLLLSLLRLPRGSVVHAHGPHAFIGEVTRLACLVRGLALVVHVHLEVGRSTRWGVLLPLYRRLVVGPVLRAADRVLVLTPDLATDLRERHDVDPSRLRVVPNAADPLPVPPTPVATERAPGAPLRVLYLGRLVPQKRVSRLLDALALCPEPTEAAVVGDGELRGALVAQADRLGLDVRFPGEVARAGVATWLQWADVVVLPSEREGMPLTLLEAMAAGVPVLATDVEGTRELVADHGLLVQTTPEALAAGLGLLAREPDLRADLAARGRARAGRDTWASIVDILEKEYDAVSSTDPSRTEHTGRPGSPDDTVAAWRPMDATDASWSGIEYTRTLWGLDVPPVERVRAAWTTIAERSPRLDRVLDVEALTWRPPSPAERAARPEIAVVAGAAFATAQQADAAAFALSREGLPARVVVGPDYVVARATHAFGDEWTALTFLNHLLAQARSDEPLPLPWTEVSSRTHQLLTVRQLATRPRAVLTALRRRSQLSGGPFEPARLNADRLRFVSTHVVSPAGFLGDLRAERKTRGLEVSMAAVTLVGLRRAVTEHLQQPLPGTEVVYDVRRESPITERALGNWVAGVFVRPADDLDVTSVHRAIAEVRTSGLSLVAAAATRRRTRRTGDHGSRLVFAPEAGLRLTLSYIPGHGPLKDAALTAPGAAYFGTNPPNGINTLTLTCAEVGDRLHLGIEHYEDVWSVELVCRAAETFFADPWGDARQVAPPVRREAV